MVNISSILIQLVFLETLHHDWVDELTLKNNVTKNEKDLNYMAVLWIGA